MKNFYLILLAFILCVQVNAQNKKPLDHSVYETWNGLYHAKITNDGNWVGYVIANRNDESELFLYDNRNNDGNRINKVDKYDFSPDSKFLTYTKIKEKNKEEGPKVKSKSKIKNYDVYIYDLEKSKTKAIKDIRYHGFISENSSLLMMIPNNKKKKKKKAKKKGEYDPKTYTLYLYDLANNDVTKIKDVKTYRYSKSGNYFIILKMYKSDKNIREIVLYSLKDRQEYKLHTGKVYFTRAVFSDDETKLSYIVKDPLYNKSSWMIRTINIEDQKQVSYIADNSENMPSEFGIDYSGMLKFSLNNESLYFKIKPKKKTQKKKDKKKKFKLNIWNWDEDALPYMENESRFKEKEVSYFCSSEITNPKIVKLSDDEMLYLQFPKGEGHNITIGFSDKNYAKTYGIEASMPYDTWLVDLKIGEKTQVLKGKFYRPTVSYDKKYIAWYEPADSCWFALNTNTKEKIDITSSIDDTFYNDETDRPMHSTPYGLVGWTKEGHDFILYSKYDVWMIDPSGENKPVCISNELGKKNKIRFRINKFNKKQWYYDLNNIQYFKAFNTENIDAGYYSYKHNKKEFKKLFLTPNKYDNLYISKNRENLIFRKASFKDYPELYLTDKNFSEIKKLSETNPQQKKYVWGDSQLVKWVSYAKDTLKGIFIVPENLDTSKKYPMLVYFYEQRSNLLHRYYDPKPIRSVFNWTYAASNGYVVFIPDVKFKDGHPGQSSYDCVISGIKEMTKRYSFIDEKNIGLDGHSWGGYQGAYLITKTNMFKAAGIGAPVMNMASGYLSMRWVSGKPRMFMYEQGQSRIGKTLWEAPELYIENSPIYGADKIQTPMLIMHNDKDGKVPWNEGIQLFLAMRRLHKPAWMLEYKGSPHYLKKYDRKVDFSKRKMEFFNYYLKGKEKPNWME